MEVQALVEKIAIKEEVKSYLIEVLEAFQKLDYHKLNDLLDNDAYYQNMRKPSFIYEQKKIFLKFHTKGDTHLELSTNICTGCLCSEPIFVFTGNTSKATYAIYVKFIEDEIVDIFKCVKQSSFSGMVPF